MIGNHGSSTIKNESAASVAAVGTGGDGGAGKTAQKPSPVDGHGASMEGAMGVPDKIDEGVEPND
jgi:hypothetical protein